MHHLILGFNGERCDPVWAATHLGNGYRAYHPALSRFNCPDNQSPFREGGINGYLYCSGDPINRTDPSGHHSVLGWLGIATGVALGVLFTPVSGGSSLTLVLSAVSVVAAINSTVLAVAQQFIEAQSPKMAADLGWAALGFGMVSGLSTTVLYRVASGPKSLSGLLRASLFKPKIAINLHPNNAAPVQFYKGAGIEPIYTEGRMTSTRVLGFTSDFNGNGEPGVIAHTTRSNRFRLNFGPATISDGTDTVKSANKQTVESLVGFFKERNIDLRNIARDKPFHLIACCVGGRNGVAQRLADVLERPVLAYGVMETVDSDGVYPLGNGQVFDDLGVPFRPIRYEPRLS